MNGTMLSIVFGVFIAIAIPVALAAEVDARRTLLEALAEVREAKDIHYRIDGLLSLASVLQGYDKDAATKAPEEAASLVNGLKVDVSLFKGVNYPLVYSLTAGPLGTYVGLLRWRETRSEAATRNATHRDRALHALAEQFTATNPKLALSFALQVTDEGVRVSAIRGVMKSWPTEYRDSMPAINDEVQSSSDSPLSLAVLADELSNHDRSAAMNLARRASSLLTSKSTPLAKSIVNAAVFKLIPGEAERVLNGLGAGGRQHPEDSIPLLIAAAAAEPNLVLRKLQPVDSDGDTDLALKAHLLRRVVRSLRADQRTVIETIARQLMHSMDAHNPIVGTKKNIRKDENKRSLITDSAVAMGFLDPQLALRELDHVHFGRSMQRRLDANDETGNKTKVTFTTCVARLDLALSLADINSRPTMNILHSLPRAFWTGLTFSTSWWQTSDAMEGSDFVMTSWQARARRLIGEYRDLWPQQVGRLLKDRDPTAGDAVANLLMAAEAMDYGAVRAYKWQDWGTPPQEWWRYLPFTLARVANELFRYDSQTAMGAFNKSMQLAEQLKSPAREWAQFWNCAVMKGAYAGGVAPPLDKAIRDIAGLTRKETFETGLTRLIAEMATHDFEAALRLAKSPALSPLRPQAIAAVFSASR